MKVLVLGGDGFCGWPTSLHLSRRGHDVVDRRQLRPPQGRHRARRAVADADRSAGRRVSPPGEEITGRDIGFHHLDVAEDYRELVDLLIALRPDAVVHFAEQRAAPYSMKCARHKRYTVNNNVNATHNLLAAIVETELDAHVVHLGHDGRLRLRHGRRHDPRGLPARPHGDRRRRRRRAGDPLPGQPGLRLPHDQDPGSAAVRVLQQERRGPRHRPAPGHRVGDPDRARPSSTSG